MVHSSSFNEPTPKITQRLSYKLDVVLEKFYDVQNYSSVQIVNSTYVVQKAKLLNYFATALKY